MSAIREFGLLQVIGILVTLVAALVVTPALLAILGRPRRRPASSRPGEEDWFGNLAAKAAEFDLAHRRAIFIAAAVTFALACIAATRLDVGSDSIKSFPPDSDLRRDFEAVNEHLEGASQFNVVFESLEPGTFLEPANLREIESFQKWLKEQPEIGGTTSVVDYLKLINRSFHDNDPAHLVIPESRDVAARLLFLGANEELESFVDRGHRMVNVLVRARVLDTAPIAALVERIEERLEALPHPLEGKVTGNLILVNRLVDGLVRSQAYSLLSGTLLIYGICWLWFLSRRTALVAMIPNVLPIAVYFGVLGITGITLNPATSVVAPMTLGIAIDDTIHYFARFNSDAKRFADERRATVTALRSVGRPVTYTTIALCVGFLVLTTSELRAWVELGALGAFTLGFAWLIDLFLTPALCGGLRVVTLWDTLTLDLGEEPQRSIPIFKGLSNTQCRIVALMASLRSIPAGQRLMSAGEQGREMYVVIDGKLRIWKEGESGPIVLNTCSRGDVVGEVGFLYKTRSANADIVEDARLLRLTPTNMERLARRYPRIAARVFRGLGEVVAERLWQTTSRLQ
jgi:predicted RND superfamily exporter protein